jgi:predicted SAM-dependent methyltransferase
MIRGAGMDFICNVCATSVTRVPIERIDREIPSCPMCGSSVRFRSIIHLLSTALFGHSIPLPDFPDDPSIIGIGLSDWLGYSKPLARKIGYINTFFHKKPFLDISQPVSIERRNTCDFVISSDVFEHVSPPVSNAFRGAFDLLKPSGHFILTVPFTLDSETIEHFSELHDYRIVQIGDEFVVHNETKDGRFMLHENPIFHGGTGTTLEMRVFCRSDLEKHLSAAGFSDIQVCNDDAPRWGIIHKCQWSLPIITKRPVST